MYIMYSRIYVKYISVVVLSQLIADTVVVSNYQWFYFNVIDKEVHSACTYVPTK